MRTAAIIALLLGSLHGAEVKIDWDYPQDEMGTNLVFIISSHTNANEPLTNWFRIVVPGTSTTARAVMVPERRFFFVTASNFWGESGPSNIADTPRPATNVTGLKLTK